MKIRELLNRFRRRPPEDGEKDSSEDSVNKAFITSSGQASSSWIPSQQDRPKH